MAKEKKEKAKALDNVLASVEADMTVEVVENEDNYCPGDDTLTSFDVQFQTKEGVRVHKEYQKPNGEPKVTIAGKEIQLTKTDDCPDSPYSFYRHDIQGDKSRGFYKYESLEQFTKLCAERKYRWWTAIVNGVKLFVTEGSILTLDTITEQYYDEQDPVPASLYLTASSLVGGHLYVSKTNKIVNGDFEFENCTMEGCDVKHSRLDGKYLNMSKSTVIRSVVKSGNVTLINAQVYDSHLGVSGYISLENKAELRKVNITDGYARSNASKLLITVPVSDFSIDVKTEDKVVQITHRAHYGYIQGIDRTPFVKLGLDFTNFLGMMIAGTIISREEALTNSRPFLMTDTDKMEQLCTRLFNQDLAPSYRRDDWVERKVPFPFTIKSQIDNIRSQIASKMELWDLIETVKGS
ncbi:hypothetical protein CF8_0149 [Aeromonas phage CF8]|nr:hypothetical protein CF8_0149 [Aeromonas phage CF8]